MTEKAISIKRSLGCIVEGLEMFSELRCLPVVAISKNDAAGLCASFDVYEILVCAVVRSLRLMATIRFLNKAASFANEPVIITPIIAHKRSTGCMKADLIVVDM
jgi:hypothetical protein